MSILLGICLLLVMISLVMALNAFTRLEQIRQHNDLMQQELSKLRQECAALQEKMTGQPYSPLLSAKKVSEEPVEQVPVEQVPVEQVPVEQVPVEQVPVDTLQQQLQAMQFILESFRKQNEGQYPHNLEILIHFADRQQLQKMVQNPFTQTQNPLLSLDTCLDITHDPADEGLAEYAGRLLFQAHLDDQDQATGYTLAAFDGKGLLLKEPNGQVLKLSHQV